MGFYVSERVISGYPNFICKVGAKILIGIPKSLNAKNP